MMKNDKTKVVLPGNLSKDEVNEAANWRHELYPSALKGKDWKPDWSRRGVELLVNNARLYYCKETGQDMPYNLATHGPWVSYPGSKRLYEGDRYNSPSKEEMVGFASRVSGWIRVVADCCPGIVRLLGKTCSSRGMGSPYTTCSPYEIFRSFPSPHRAERQFWKIRQRANQVLAPYGISVSWQALGQAMAHQPRSVGKAALWAANYTIKEYLKYYDNGWRENFCDRARFFYLRVACGLADMKNYPDAIQRWAMSRVFDGEFQSLRQALLASSRLELDNTDGVEMYIDPATRQVIHRVEAMKGWMTDKSDTFGNQNCQYLFRQIGTGRTFHYYPSDVKWGVRQAISAWRRQAELERRDADLISFLRGELGFCPLIRRQESYRSGNCQTGTESWISRHGWSGRTFIPAEMLIPYLSESRVRNAALILYQDLAGLKIAA